MTIVPRKLSLVDQSFEFTAVLRAHGLPALARAPLTTLQVNLGKFCNMACQHCHDDAGPKRTEIMARHTLERVVALLDANPQVELVDVTGGAPELNPNFRYLVSESRRRGRKVIDRCNLTVLLEPELEGVIEFLVEQGVRLVASLPCYLEQNVDRQRGPGAFAKSIAALQTLNARGYGRPGQSLELDLVYNPLGPSLPAPQPTLEAAYKTQLFDRYGIEFNQLLTLTNMPISRFRHALQRDLALETYEALLLGSFNPLTVPNVMCRSLLSVSWDGKLYDCDFNQMLELELGAAEGAHARTIWDIESFAELEQKPIAVGRHCLGCTAGSGSSCSGALA
jgi:radical SAM/Cys-rich protein